MLMRGTLLVILVVAILAIGSAQSQAQEDVFGVEGLPLTTKDFAAMASAANPLLNDEACRWARPASGATRSPAIGEELPPKRLCASRSPVIGKESP
jgi:hypothetical protein